MSDEVDLSDLTEEQQQHYRKLADPAAREAYLRLVQQVGDRDALLTLLSGKLAARNERRPKVITRADNRDDERNALWAEFERLIALRRLGEKLSFYDESLYTILIKLHRDGSAHIGACLAAVEAAFKHQEGVREEFDRALHTVLAAYQQLNSTDLNRISDEAEAAHKNDQPDADETPKK